MMMIAAIAKRVRGFVGMENFMIVGVGNCMNEFSSSRISPMGFSAALAAH